MKLLITKRSSDYHVCIDGHPEWYGSGTNVAQAVGNCVMDHSDKLQIKLIQKRELTIIESIHFNIFIDKMGIINDTIYQELLNDFLGSKLSIEDFIKYFNSSHY